MTLLVSERPFLGTARSYLQKHPEVDVAEVCYLVSLGACLPFAHLLDCRGSFAMPYAASPSFIKTILYIQMSKR